MTHRPYALLLSLVLLCLIPLCFSACTSSGNGQETAADTPTPDTAPDDPASDAPVDAPTEAPTEADTEPETLSLAAYYAGDDIVVKPTVAEEHPLKKLVICGHDVTEGNMAVVIGDEAEWEEISAGELIRTWIENATGVHLPLRNVRDAGEYAFRIMVGDVGEAMPAAVTEARGTLTSEGYALIADGGQLYLTGASVRGTWNGAVCFVEDYVGARFFTEDCEAVIPADLREVPADVNTVYSPPFDYRCEYYGFNDNGTNNDYNRIHKLNPVSYAIFQRVHTLYYLAEMTGEANKHQPCMTDENVYQTVLKNVRIWLADNPKVTAISVSQNDSENESQLGCQCENCKALNKKYGTEGGALFEFVNRIARDIRDEYPGVMVETLAYQYSIKPPKDFVFEDNVLVQLCLIDTCFAHTLDDPTCSINKHYCDTLNAWSEVCEHISIWDYHTNFNFYPSFFPNEEILYDDMTYYANHHVVSVFNQGNDNTRAGNFEELRAYISAQLLWNPSMTREQYNAMIDEFMTYFYGDGWPYIRRMFDAVTAKAQSDGHHFNIWDKPEKVLPYNARNKDDKAFAEGMWTLCCKALDAAATEVQQAHVRKAGIQALYYRQLFVGKSKSDENTALNKMLYERIKEFGIVAIGAWTPLADVKDFSINPAKWG